ncbi:MAG TPA: carotenoid biosynthesis protein [Cyanothece sp. UBA12306]|nr:carotenoid biosynthesis protein [Cyanothece sp. UBA12306]
MKNTLIVENSFLTAHILSMAFGLVGILLVLPNAEFLTRLTQFGQIALAWSMAGGGVIYILLGTIAVSIYAYRVWGTWHWLGFMLPAISISLTSELLGTSTGFPFGHYHYLSGLGYKIAGLVPVTIPLSWFYLGFSAYVIARVSLATVSSSQSYQYLGAIFLGAILLTSWDFVLDPAMSQTDVPFWYWDQPGAFFGMPYQNFAGWLGTSILFMGVATLIWRFKPMTIDNKSLELPLAIYLSNFAFATIMSLASGIYTPIYIGLILGVLPILILYQLAQSTPKKSQLEGTNDLTNATESFGLRGNKVK